MKKTITICDCCGKGKRTETVYVEVGTQTGGPNGHDPIMEELDLCHECMTKALQWVSNNHLDSHREVELYQRYSKYKREHPQEATR